MRHTVKITFFMLVTNRDCIIADYAIASYKKIYEKKMPFGFEDFTLFIYMNCLSPENKQRYQRKWESYPYTKLFDNIAKIKDAGTLYPGQKLISPEGIERNRDDYAESYDELWTTELKKFDTPFIATVDADFEILNADFYFYLIHQLCEDKNCIGASSSFNADAYVHDTYSKRNILLSQRNHTWFCIYKKRAFELSSCSHYYYERKLSNEATMVFDSSAYFQHDLRINHQLTFASLPKQYQSSFVHYGASSKNISLTRKNIGCYRLVFLGATAGFLYGKKNSLAIFVNKIVRTIVNRIFGSYLDKYRIERSTYIYDKKN